jgi:hypothetical protein
MVDDSSDALPWRRWWGLVAEPLELLGGATLPDPASSIGRAINPGLRLLRDLGDVPAIVLLGDAGMGKSAELHLEDERLGTAGLTVIHRNLGEYGSEASIERMFDDIAAQGGDQSLALLLDGYDEALGFAPKLPELLVRRLKGPAPQFSHVRIASRPSARRGPLDAALEELVGRVEVRGLAPLTSGDIRLAAAQRGMDPEAFVDAVAAADAWPLAARPLTLKLLLNTFASDGLLPPTRRELYELQVPSLLAEHDKERAAATSAVPVGERQTAAEELAALMLLGGYPTVVPYSNGAPDGALVLESVLADCFDSAQAVLQSSLMTSAGSGLQWTHRTFAEYLCARRLTRLEPDAAFRLLALPHQVSTIAPAVSGIAGWLAEESAEFAALLAARNPEALLGAPMAGRTDSERSEIVGALLAGCEDTPPQGSLDYRNLRYSAMTDDLAGVVGDPDRPWWVRRETLQMWWANGVGDVELLMDLVEQGVAPNASDEAVDLAGWALLTLEALPPGSETARLSELASDPSLPSVIRTGLLHALHPQRIGIEAFLALVPGALAEEGAVAQAVSRIVGQLDLTDEALLGTVAQWLADHPGNAAHERDYTRVAEEVMLLVGVSDSPHLRALASTLAARQLQQTYQLLPNRTTKPLSERSQAQRLRLGEALMADVAPTLRRTAAFALRRVQLLRTIDLTAWLDAYEQAVLAQDSSRQDTIRSFLDMLAGPETVETARAEAAERPALEAVTEEFFGTDRLQAWEAQKASIEQQDREARESREAEMFSLVRLDEAIARRDWIAVVGELRRPTPDGPDGQQDWGSLRHHPAWADLDEQRRAACRQLALEVFGDSPSGGGTPSTHAAVAAVEAFDLLAEADVQLAAADVKAWLPHVIALPSWEEAVTTMISLAAASDPAFVDETLLAALAQQAPLHASVLNHIGDHWSKTLQKGLLEVAAIESTSSTAVRVILMAVDAHDSQAAIDSGLAMIAEAPARRPDNPADDSSWGRAVAAFGAIAESVGAADNWEAIHTLLIGRADLARDAISAGGHLAGQRLFSNLRPAQLADIYRWATSALPSPERHEPGVIYTPDPLAEFAGGIVAHLTNHGSADAAEQLAILASETDNPYLRSRAKVVRAGAWTPYPLDELRELLANDQRRHIETAEQLAEAVLTALRSIQDRLNRDAPTRRNFWDRIDSGSYRPRIENEATDQLKLLLEQELGAMVLLHREVEIEPRIGHQSGQDTDLLIAVVGPDGAVYCTVEVKCSWNPEVRTGLTEQLVDRYLQGSEGQTGIFLVLHFVESEQWVASGPRKRHAFDHAMVKELLDTQASAAADRATVHPFILRIALELNTRRDAGSAD